MALTERQEQLLEILPNGVIQVRDTRIIMDDGVEISRSHHRKVVDVGQDTSNESPRLQRIAASEWTTDVRNKRRDEINKNRNNI